MQLSQKNSTLACGDVVIVFGDGAHAGELVRGHDEEELILGIRKKNEFLSSLAAPAGRDGDAIFFVDGVKELTGVKGLGWGNRIHRPAGLSSTLIHFVPLLTTTSPCGQYFFVRSFLLSNKSRSKKKFGCRPAVARLWRSGTLQHRIDYPRHGCKLEGHTSSCPKRPWRAHKRLPIGASLFSVSF